MTYYKYYDEITNTNEVKDFFNKTNFIGYILPDGNIYPCEKHNIESVISVFNLELNNLINHFDDRDKFLVKESSDPLLQLILDFFWSLTHDMVIKLNEFIENNSLNMSDILVSLFGCHLVTRLNKKILTSSVLHYSFYNYILMDFKIETVPKIVYKNDKFLFQMDSLYNNDFLLDEIKEIKDVTNDDEKKLFFR